MTRDRAGSGPTGRFKRGGPFRLVATEDLSLDHRGEYGSVARVIEQAGVAAVAGPVVAVGGQVAVERAPACGIEAMTVMPLRVSHPGSNAFHVVALGVGQPSLGPGTGG